MLRILGALLPTLYSSLRCRRDLLLENYVRSLPRPRRLGQRCARHSLSSRRAGTLIFDRDAIFAAEVVATLRSMSIESTRTRYQSPWQDGVAERFVATVRRESLDHVIVLNEAHLRKLLGHFLDYHHLDRTHLGLDKDSPLGRPVEPRPHALATVAALLRVEGLHRRYYWRQAA